MKQINFELTLLQGRTSKSLNFLSPSEEVSPSGAPAPESLFCQRSVSLYFLETKGIGGDGGTDTGQHLGVLSSGPFFQNIQGK